MEKLPPLRMYWLGHPRVELDGKPLKFEMRKALALLVYLSLEHRPVSRETLATLFWPEFSQQNALANLRRNLSSLETTLPGGWLMASRETINLAQLEKTWIDTQSFCQHIQAVLAAEEVLKNGEEALRLYRGPFLEGFNLPDCPEFDDWQYYQRENFQKDYGTALEQLVHAHANASNWEAATACARRWVALDKFHEPAQQVLIRLLAQSGQRSAALHQFDDFKQLLKAEFDQEPSPETTNLYNDIHAGRVESVQDVQRGIHQTGQATKVETASPTPPHTDLILKTKLFFPKIPARLVERKRVIELLNLGLERRLTLISAPAGYGKTTLLGSWIRQCPYPVAWLSLDATDNDPSHFVKYIVAALQSALSEHADPIEIQPPPAFFSYSASSATSFLASQLNQLCDLDIPIVLVLDDYQFISNREAHNLTAFLIDKMPPHMNLVIASRIDPPFPIARLRAAGQVQEIRTLDVRFTDNEILDFYQNVMSLDLTADDLAVLANRTEGWAAGLQMAALVMKAFDVQSRQGREQFLASFRGSQRFIMDYLVEEVLDQLPQELKEFLLQTSILEKLSGQLCDAVMSRAADGDVPPQGTGQEILENLERSNYFVVPMDDTQTWFRYHHLFRDLLRARLEKTRPSLVPDLHQRASEWYERNGLIEEAIHHSGATADHERTAALLELCIERMLNEGGISTVMEWCSELPEEIIGSHPWLCIEFLRGAYLKGTLNQYHSLIQSVERHLQEHADISQPRDRKMLAHFNVVKANLAFLNRDMEGTIRFGDQAIQLMPKESQVRQGTLALVAYTLALAGEIDRSEAFWQEMLSTINHKSDVYAQTLSLGAFSRSFFLYTRGYLRQSYEICESAVEILTSSGKHELPGAGLVDLGISFTLADWGNYEEAEPICKGALGNLESLGMPDFIMLARQCLAVIQRHRGDIEAADVALKQGWDFIRNVSVDPMKLAGYRHQQVLTWIAMGELDRAEQLLRDASLNLDDPVTLVRDRDFISLAHVYLARARQGDRQWLGQAESLLLQNVASAERYGWSSSLIENLALLAAVQKEQGREGEAAATLGRALTLAEPEGYIQLFLEAGQPVGDLLAKLPAPPVSADYIRRIQAGFQRETQNSTPQS